MTSSQQRLYWREWAKVRRHKIKVESWTGADADQFRHALTIRALGFDKSHKDFTNAEFDKILGLFRAVTRPEDTGAQVRQLDQPLTRAQHVLDSLIEELGLEMKYVDAMARRICKRSADNLTERDCTKLIAALNLHKKRLAKKGQVQPASTDPF